jgi:hypothetical protein
MGKHGRKKKKGIITFIAILSVIAETLSVKVMLSDVNN